MLTYNTYLMWFTCFKINPCNITKVAVILQSIFYQPEAAKITRLHARIPFAVCNLRKNKDCFFTFWSNISKTSASVSSGFKMRETLETTRPQVEWFYCFRAFGNLLKHEAQGFEISSPTQKISLSYHLNKFSQFNFYIWVGKYTWS